MAFVQHIPVMVEVVAKLLLTRGNGFYVDATIGTGGHTAYLLKQGGEGMRILGVDRDAKALGEAQRRLGPLGNNVTFVTGNFRHIRQLTKGRQCDGFLLDLGLSSFQLSDPERGFSYLQEGPLDMSMGGDGRSVGELLATADERELGRILKDYGEERRYRAIAREIVQTRSLKRLTGTSQLRKIVENVEIRIHDYDVIVAMESQHREAIVKQSPKCVDRVVVWYITDPYAEPYEHAQQIFKKIKSKVAHLAQSL